MLRSGSDGESHVREFCRTKGSQTRGGELEEAGAVLYMTHLWCLTPGLPPNSPPQASLELALPPRCLLGSLRQASNLSEPHSYSLGQVDEGPGAHGVWGLAQVPWSVGTKPSGLALQPSHLLLFLHSV